MRPILSLSFMVLLLFPVALATAQTTREPDTPPTAGETLAALPWLELDRVEVDEADNGDTVLTVTYLSAEFNLVAYRAEMLEVFRVLGTTDLDGIDTVVLISAADMGFGVQGIEQATIDTDTLADFAVGGLTRTAFLDEADIAPLEHGAGEGADQAPA